MPRSIISILLLICGTDAYFSWNDCNPDCIHYRACCTITEINPNYFPSQCTKTQATCEQLASPTVVCLRPDDVPLGGQEIWPSFDKYKQRHRITTPTPHHPTFKPNLKPDCMKWKILAIIVTSLMSLYAFLKLVSKAIRHFRTRAYESIAPSQENPVYNPTVEEIREPEAQ